MTTAIAAATTTTTAQPAPAGTFSFLKHGVVIPARRCGLFLKLFALNVALSTALFVSSKTLVAPRVDVESAGVHRAGIEDAAVDGDAEVSFSWLCQLLAAPTAYLALHLAVALVQKVATATAAVAACSDEPHTFGSFLRRVRGNLLGASATVALGVALRAACAAAAATSVLALPALAFWGGYYSRQLLLLDALLAVLAFQLYFYLDVVCAMAVVASAAGPRGGAIGAVARAWRAMAGTTGRAFLYAVVTMALGVAVRSASDLAAVSSRVLPRAMDNRLEVAVLVDGGVEYVLHFVVEVFSVVAITAYYFECRKIRKEEEDKAGHAD